MVSPVDGLIVGNVLPDAASVHLLFISSFVALTFTVGSMAVEAVAMRIPPKKPARLPRCLGQAGVKFCSRNPGRTGQPLCSSACDTKRRDHARRVAQTKEAYSPEKT